jgi:hypothetical protein
VIEMNAKYFAWFYLIEKGAAGSRYSYYGGMDLQDERLKEFFKGHCFTPQERNEVYLNEIRTIGIDWDKTDAPSNGSHSVFQGTFCDAGTSEHIEGTLVLKDGLKQTWVAEALQVNNVFKLMADTRSFEERMIELFGNVE